MASYRLLQHNCKVIFSASKSALQLLLGTSSFVKVLSPQKANVVYLAQDKAA